MKKIKSIAKNIHMQGSKNVRKILVLFLDISKSDFITFLLITSKRLELGSRGWSQIAQNFKTIKNHLNFLRLDSEKAKLLWWELGAIHIS